METIEVDNIHNMKASAFDPLTTPYEVSKQPFPEGGSLAEQFTHILRYAILAPSSHNTQPWKFRLFENGIALFADYTRRLPVADPNNRELLMGVGAAIANLRIAALHFGFEVHVDYNFSGDSELPLAFVTLSKTVPRKEEERSVTNLFRAIVKRHTNRHPFLRARVPDTLLSHLAELGNGTDVSMFISTDPKRNAAVAELVARAERLQQTDPGFRKELSNWMRPNNTQHPDGMPGAAFGIGNMASTVASWAVKTIDMGRFRARHDERLCVEAPALLVLHSEETVPAWIAVGEVLEKVLLTLTSDGLQFSFFNMPVEIPEARQELRDILGVQSFPQLLLRVGYSLEKPVPSPRRPVEDCMYDDRRLS